MRGTEATDYPNPNPNPDPNPNPHPNPDQVDFDIGLRNLDLHLGCERRIVFDFVNVIQSECKLHQALIKDRHQPNLFMLAASQTRDKTALTADGVEVRMLTASHPLYTCLPSTPLHPCTLVHGHARIVTRAPRTPSCRR